ncbi:MAG: TetR/AcrR family transcriptional regulator, partial [Acidobacteria bacterium]|nr:TetR/AcrR family transcriptional regulator [Acidobacteriota bacterium]
FEVAAMREPKQARAVATRQRILTEAAQLFGLKGYHDTKLEEVLKAARMTMGAFFHHFESKEDLGFAVLDDHMEERRQQLEQREPRLRAPDDDPLEQVFRRLDAYAAMACVSRGEKGGCVIGNLSTSLSDTHDGFRQRLAECFDEMAREFQEPLAAAVKKYGPGRRVDTEALARHIVAVIEGTIILARTHRDRHMMKRQFDYLKEHLRQTLGA